MGSNIRDEKNAMHCEAKEIVATSYPSHHWAHLNSEFTLFLSELSSPEGRRGAKVCVLTLGLKEKTRAFRSANDNLRVQVGNQP